MREGSAKLIEGKKRETSRGRANESIDSLRELGEGGTSRRKPNVSGWKDIDARVKPKRVGAREERELMRKERELRLTHLDRKPEAQRKGAMDG